MRKPLNPIAILLVSLPLVWACSSGPGSEASDAGPVADAGSDSDASPPCTATCDVNFAYPVQQGVSRVELRGDFGAEPWTSGVELVRNGDVWTTELELEDGELLEYKFVLNGQDWVLDPVNRSRQPDASGTLNSVVQADCGCSQSTFDWRDGILYFVFLDRFRDGDASNNVSVEGVPFEANYQGGDLAGLTDKIEEGYFDDLGVNALWITSPLDNAAGLGLGTDGRSYSSYHGYWPRDMEAIDAHLGNLADMQAMVDAAHERGIKVILDYAMNHVHAESPLYSENPTWFWPNENGFGGNCVCGSGCEWEGDQGRRCWFTDYLPDFNFTNDDARAWSVNNAMHWIRNSGVDGLRLDAIKHIESSWLYDLRKRVREEIEPERGEDFYMVGETFSADSALISSYVDPLTQLDGQFDFPLRAEVARTLLRRDGSLRDLANFLASQEETYHPASIMSTFIGNHDLPRVIHLAEDNPRYDVWDSATGSGWDNPPGQPSEKAPYERMALGFAFLFTSPGVPLIYYGDEIGMAGAGDPDNRRFMQWEGTSEHQEWMKARVAKLGTIRKEQGALRRGVLTVLAVNDDTIVYEMVRGSDRIVVAMNRADISKTAEGVPSGSYTELLEDTALSTPITLPPRSAAILLRQ